MYTNKILGQKMKKMALVLHCMYLSTSLIISSTSSSVNLDDHMIIVFIITLVMISWSSIWMITWSSPSSSSWSLSWSMIILIITQPHLPLLSHDLPQLLCAQCSRAILIKNLQRSFLSYYLAKKLFCNLERLFQTIFSLLCAAKLGPHCVCQLGHLNV